MKQLLITGFDPFGGEQVNPSWEAVLRLPEQIGEYRLTKLQIPTAFGLALEKVTALAETLQPDAILCIGQAGGRKAITPEVVAINLREARIPDNVGNQPVNTPVEENGPAAYFTTVPVRKMVDAVQAAGIPCALSYSAGAFVCNDVLYGLLHRYREGRVSVGFIHVPYLPEQAGDNVPSLSLNDMVLGLNRAILAMSEA